MIHIIKDELTYENTDAHLLCPLLGLLHREPAR